MKKTPNNVKVITVKVIIFCLLILNYLSIYIFGQGNWRPDKMFMSLRLYLIIMSFASAICWFVWIFVIWTVNPETTNWVGFLLFYLSLFLSLVGTSAIVGFLIRFVGLKKHLEAHSVKEASRQSFLFAFFIVIVLFLLAKNLFNWLSLATLIIGLSVFEFLLISYRPINQENIQAPENIENNEIINIILK